MFWLLIWTIIEHAVSIPCGAGSICSCYAEINMITCAAKGLTEIPSLMLEDKRMCKILILDSNHITSLDKFVINEWPQLRELRVRKNPEEICVWIDAIKMEASDSLVVLDDCQKTNLTAKKEISIHHPLVRDITTTMSTSKVTESIKLTTASGKKDAKGADDYQENSDETVGGEAIFTSHGNRNVKIGMTTEGYIDSNTTAKTGESWSVTGDITGEGLTVIVTIPVTLFGIGMLVIRIVWRKRRPKYLGFSVDTRNSHELESLQPDSNDGGARPKRKSSPTPSRDSENVEFDRAALNSNSSMRRKSRESEYYISQL